MLSLPAVLDAEAILANCLPVTLAADTVHLWTFSQRALLSCRRACLAFLSGTERVRADRFVYDKDRDDYIVAHGVMRHVLGRYTGIPPAQLRFDISETGKPSLPNDLLGSSSLSFNLSHANGRALLAVTSREAVGADIEFRRDDISPLSIARNYFYGHEFDDIESADDDAKHDEFFRYWVAKESVLKAQGVGLGYPLDQFEVRFALSGESARIISHDPERLSADWVVRPVVCDPGWFAAVAMRGDGWTVTTDLA